VRHLRSLNDALFYDYWLTNSTIALGLLRRRGVVRRAIARAHNFDLYDEVHEYGAVPYRNFAVRSLDRVFPISADGLTYLALKHPHARPKLILSRLGVPRQAIQNYPSNEGRPLIVSCSSMLPAKRVHLIPEVLARVGRPLRWVHFGDGPDRERVTVAAAKLPEGIEWRLEGHVDHNAVIDFYRQNKVDLLISTSASEGVPVSMMEAISFGVPILATSVGGVSEVVSQETGDLAELDVPPHALAARARLLLEGGAPSRDRIVAFFKARFDATKNFAEFVDLLREV
jgi:glycosyltransferase involved in cell wall biosynthesis